MMTSLERVFAGALLASTLGTATAGEAASTVIVEAPYARAVVAGQPNSAAFMTLMNTDAMDHAVVEAASPVAGLVELHTHINDGGVMRMRRIERIEVKAGDKTVLKPGGLHVMLMQLRQPLPDGSDIAVTLRFEDGTETSLDVPVRSIMKMMGVHKQHQHRMQGAGQKSN